MKRSFGLSIVAVVTAALLAFGGIRAAAGQEPEAKTESTAKAAPETAEHAAPAHAPAGGKGEHHDPHDLTHGNASPGLSQAQELRFDLSLATLLVFILLLAILTKFAWGPIATALERREETISRQIEEARLASEKAAASLREYEARLVTATDEARQIVAQARKDAEVAKDKIVAEARDAASRERDRAVADINTAKNQALDAIAQKSVETAVSLARNILRREVRPQEHEALIGDAINELSKMN